MPDLYVIFLIGLLGSAHCIGMCGGFALALAHHPPGSFSRHGHQAVYFLGKTTTYALLGALAGGGGALLLSSFAHVQDGLSITLGVVLVAVGLSMTGFPGRLIIPVPQRLTRSLAGYLAALIRRRTLWGTFGLGQLNGLLPCALVYGMLAKAGTTGSPLDGALTMTVFGLSTIPALYLTALLGRLARPGLRKRLNFAAGVLVLLLGLVTIARGTPARALFHPREHSVTVVSR